MIEMVRCGVCKKRGIYYLRENVSYLWEGSIIHTLSISVVISMAGFLSLQGEEEKVNQV